jgi:hypothetical protein
MNNKFTGRVLKNLILFSLFFLVSFSWVEDVKENASPYYNLEKTIKEKYDARAVFTWDQYLDFLKELSNPKFKVMPLHEMASTFDSSKVVVGLRHDVDMNPFKALEMAKIEKAHAVRATYFLLETSDYAGKFVRSKLVRSQGVKTLYREIYETGAEIGIHNDLLAVMILYHIDPLKFNRDELSFFKSINIPIYGTASHGSEVAKRTVPNFQIFSDFAKKDSVSYNGKKYPLGKYSLNKYGYQYEAYFINHNLYFSDSNGKWNDPEGYSGIVKKLKASHPGDRIEILAHPDWWGKAPAKAH